MVKRWEAVVVVGEGQNSKGRGDHVHREVWDSSINGNGILVQSPAKLLNPFSRNVQL